MLFVLHEKQSLCQQKIDYFVKIITKVVFNDSIKLFDFLELKGL